MLELTIPPIELFDERTGMFITTKEQHLQLEHSLVSLHKWESKWHKPFITKEPMTRDETLDYIRCMTINSKNVDPMIYKILPDKYMQAINEYISNPMTATWFGERKKKTPNHRIITSELLYCWMIDLNIPVEFEKWHLNQLITLIDVCNEEHKPQKNSSTNSLINKYAAMNRANRAKYNSKG